MQRNKAGQTVGAQMIEKATGDPFTGQVTVYVTLANGTQTLGTVGSGIATHKGKGYHVYTPSQAETDSNHSGYTFEGTGAITVTVQATPSSEVWDVDYSLHKIAGTFGKLMDILRKANLTVEATVTADIEATTNTFSVDLTLYPTGAFRHAVMTVVEDSVILEQNSPIETFTNNTTFSTIVLEEALTAAPHPGDVIVIAANSHVHSISAIVSGVWSALTSGLDVVGSTGRALARLIGLVEDSSGDRFTAKALEEAPSGSSTVQVLPALGVAAGRGDQTSLVAFVGETITTSITVYQSDGVTPYNLSGKTLAIIFENPKTGDDVAVVSSGSITISGASNNVVTFAYPAAATSAQRELVWTMRDAAAPKTVYLRGMLEVRSAPLVDV